MTALSPTRFTFTPRSSASFRERGGGRGAVHAWEQGLKDTVLTYPEDMDMMLNILVE